MEFNLKIDKERMLLKEYLSLLFKSGISIIEVNEKKKKRSNNANSLYWQWLSIISNETGDDVESLHFAFKGKFLGWKITETKFSKSKKPKSSRKLNVSEFYQFMLQVEIFAKDFLGITLPQPTKSILNAVKKFKENAL